MHHPVRRRPLAVVIAALPFALLASDLAHAQSAAAAPAPMMKEMVVSATRTEQEVDDVAATITSIDDKRIDREMPTDLEDLLRYEAGVSVRAQPNRSSAVFRSTGRGGNEGINVRGLEGNQVLLQVDGVRLPAGWTSGPYSAGRGDYIDVEAYKRVEILRGPSSTQFGSDGLSGAVSFVTKDPADLLTLGKPLQGAVKIGYSSVDDSWQLVPSVAFRNDTVQGMVLASLRRGHETETMGSNDSRNVNRTTPNPANNKSDYVLAKLVVTPAKGHEFKLTVESLDRRNDTDILSFFGDPFGAATLTGVAVREDITRELYKLDYRYTNPDSAWVQIANASVWRQTSQNRQFGLETRSTAPLVRTRDTTYGEEVTGVSLQLESHFGKAVTHRLVYGLDASQTDVTSMKNGYNSSAPVFVPNKSFPDTDYRLFGAFLQDEIGIGSLSIIPGLRFDSFKLTPKPDALYRVNNTVQPTTLEGDELSPKLGVIWKLTPLANLFAQYAHGFRAPLPEQVNGGVTNLTATPPYTYIGNANLKPEKSDSIEFGLRGHTNTLRYSASIFHNKYKDFIASGVQIGGSGTVADPNRFQAVNLSNVEIKGFEARGEWAFRRDWVASASYAHARGDSTTNGVSTPLNTIDPDKLVLGVRYDSEGRYGAQAMLTAVEGKKRNPTPTNYTPGSYEVVDLTGWYHLNKATTLNVAVNNLFNTKHFQWADVRDIAANSTTLDAYSQPGRNFSISLKHQF